MYQFVQHARQQRPEAIYNLKSPCVEIESQRSTIIDVEEPLNPELRQQSSQQKYLGGLKSSLRIYLGLTAVILVFNVSWLIWAIRSYKPVNGYGTIYQGTCKDSVRLNLWFHFVINVLSTGLLLGSASFLSAASSPSRGNIDAAHHKAGWLSIGLLSMRNMGYISVDKVIVCALLATSSIPIHLFFNSVIYPSLAANDYLWAVVDDRFIAGALFDVSNSNYNTGWAYGPLDDYWPSIGWDPNVSDWQVRYEKIQKEVGTYQQLENIDCIRAYSPKLIFDRRHVVMITTARNDTNSVFAYSASEIDNEGNTDPTNWICSHDPYSEDTSCDASSYLEDPDDWTLYGYNIAFCLSELNPEPCSVNFSTDLAVIVIICNVVKLGIEAYILFYGELDKAIASLGDAMASFMIQEDEMTIGMGIVDIRDINKMLKFPAMAAEPKSYHKSRQQWSTAVSKRRWLLSISMLLLSCLIVTILLAWALRFLSSKGFDTSLSGLWTLGFGQIDPEILVAPDSWGNPLLLSLLANTPQLILAVLYYTYHAMLTSFFAAQEYASFGTLAAYLRVSSPVGKQRGTWLLGMPAHWGVLFLGIQVLLHWFVSQGLFVAEVTVYSETGTESTEFGSIHNCGFSPMPMVFAIIVAIVMMVIVIGLGLRKFPSDSPPVAGNSSATIAAGCHSRVVDSDIKYKKLKWGLTHVDAHDLGHCSFTSAETLEEEREIVRVKHELLYH